MKVTFHHTHAYDWQKVTFDEVMRPSLDEKGKERKDEVTGETLYEQINPEDVLATNIQGDLTRRFEVESDNTTVNFSPFAVELIQQEQAAIGKRQGRSSIIAELLQDGAAAVRFPNDKITDITIEPKDAALRTYLLEHFAVGQEPTLPPAPEETS